MAPRNVRVTQQIVGFVNKDAEPNTRALVKLSATLRVGAFIRIKSSESKKGPNSDFTQVVGAIYVEGKSVSRASERTKRTSEILVAHQVYKGDVIYLIAIESSEPRPSSPSRGSPTAADAGAGGKKGRNSRGKKGTKARKRRDEVEEEPDDDDDDDDDDGGDDGGGDDGNGDDDGDERADISRSLPARRDSSVDWPKTLLSRQRTKDNVRALRKPFLRSGPTRALEDNLAALPDIPDDLTASKERRDEERVLEKLERYVAVRVFYATNRKPSGSRDPNKFFTGQRSDSEDLSLGTCLVSIPKDHRIGKLETASIWRLQLHEDPTKHVTLLNVHPLAEGAFYEKLAACLSRSRKREALVFVHGFNVTFRDAARRTAQLAYDLRLDGAPIFYSWPSRGKLSLAAYRHDANNVRWAAIHLERFLVSIASKAPARTVHLIAHSMGNQALTEALCALSAKLKPIKRPAFREVVLTAPDIDAALFKQLARQFKGSAKRITLYASSNDKALVISKKYLGDYPRAGDSGNGIVVIPGVDSIDVSEVSTDLIGHSYFGDNDSVLSDLFYLLAEGKPPAKRFGLIRRTATSGKYWYFQPRK